MSKNLVLVQQLFDDVIKRCDTLLKNNFDKFLDYAKSQEVLRSEFIKTSNDYKYLKTWLDKACEDIITLQSEEQNDLSKLYEVLVRKDCVKKFYDYVKDLEALKLNLAETINKYKNLNRMMNTANVDIILLKSEFNDFNKSDKESSRKTVVKELLNAEQEALRLKFIDKIKDCERLKDSLDSASKSIVVLRSKHDELLKRYRELSENNIVKEFIDTAKNQEIVPVEVTEKPKESGCSKASLERAKKEIESLNLQLAEARKMLKSERLKREQIEKEFDLTVSVSALTRSLLNHKQNETDDMGLNSSVQDSANTSVLTLSRHSDSNIGSDSSPTSEVNETESKNNGIDFIEIIPCDAPEQNQISYLNEDDDEPVVIKEEKVDVLSVSPAANRTDKLTECSSLPCEDDRLFQNEPTETASTSTTTNNNGVSFVAIENLSLIDRLLLCKRPPTDNNQKPVIKKKCTEVQESSSSEKHQIPDRRKLRDRKAKTNAIKVSKSKHKSRSSCNNSKKNSPTKPTTESSSSKKVVVEVLFSCEKCHKSFVVKPNEKRLRMCPFCDLIGSRNRVGEGSNQSKLKMTYGSFYEVRNE
ncbi:uncharacterized protein LOC135838796 isoform X1 [Planococcus citri]|uniref:uncharacterized protein LOC135838796 isoform X1 n=1 Tax=Planococcus citri TaxID=170843 RepID=UPI0031F95912